MQRVSVTVQQSGQAADAPEGSQGIESVGFIDNQKGVVVLQLLNHDSTQRTVGLDCQGRVARIDLPAVSITTARFALAK